MGLLEPQVGRIDLDGSSVIPADTHQALQRR